MAQTTSLVFNGGVIPSPSPAPSGNGKAKLLKIGKITIIEQDVQVTKNVICDPDSITTVAPFMEVLTPARLAELISANNILVLDDGTMQYLMSDANIAVEDGTAVCTAVNFLGLSKENRAKVLYPCTRLTDELTLQQVIEVGEPVETGFDLVKAYPEDTEAGTLIDKLEVVDNIRDPDDTPLLHLEVTVDDQGNRKVAINEDVLTKLVDGLPSDEHGYFNSSLYTTPGDGTTTNLVMGDFRISENRDVHGDSIEFVPTHQEGGVDFGEVWLEPGTYVLATQFTLQWVGNPRGTFLPLVANVADQPFDFSYEHEDVVRTTRIITRTTRGRLVVNIAIDADTPPMGVWVKNLEVAQIASLNQLNVAHDTTLTGTGKVADPLGITPAAFGKVKDIPTSIGQFRNGDVIPVDGPNGPAKMNKDDLLEETAQNALEVVKPYSIENVPSNVIEISQEQVGYKIRVSDGSIVTASGGRVYRINDLPSYVKKIRVVVDLDSTSYAIAFYSSNSDSDFMSGVAGVSHGMKVYEASVPAGCKMVCVMHTYSAENPSAIIRIVDDGYLSKSLTFDARNVSGELGSSTSKVIEQKKVSESIASVKDNALVATYNVSDGLFGSGFVSGSVGGQLSTTPGDYWSHVVMDCSDFESFKFKFDFSGLGNAVYFLNESDVIIKKLSIRRGYESGVYEFFAFGAAKIAFNLPNADTLQVTHRKGYEYQAEWQPGHIKLDGNIVTSSVQQYTQVNVRGAKKLYVFVRRYGADDSSAQITFYDKEGCFISNSYKTYSSDASYDAYLAADVPPNAVFARVMSRVGLSNPRVWSDNPLCIDNKFIKFDNTNVKFVSGVPSGNVGDTLSVSAVANYYFVCFDKQQFSCLWWTPNNSIYGVYFTDNNDKILRILPQRVGNRIDVFDDASKIYIPMHSDYMSQFKAKLCSYPIVPLLGNLGYNAFVSGGVIHDAISRTNSDGNPYNGQMNQYVTFKVDVTGVEAVFAKLRNYGSPSDHISMFSFFDEAGTLVQDFVEMNGAKSDEFIGEEVPSGSKYCLITSRSTFAAEIFGSSVGDIQNDIVNYGVKAFHNDTYYAGEQISVRKNKVTIGRVGQAVVPQYVTYGGSDLAGQAVAIYGNIMFRMYNKGYCKTFEIDDGFGIKAIGSFELGSFDSDNHANSAQFSDVIADTGYPYLYVASTLENKCYVEKVTATSAELVQTISYTIASHPNVRFNAQVGDGFLWLFGGDTTTNGSLYIYKFNLPSLSSASVTLLESDAIDSFSIPDYNYNADGQCQGGKIYGNKLYWLFGADRYYSTWKRRLVVIDLVKKSVVSSVDLSNNIEHEVEDLDFIRDVAIIAVNQMGDTSELANGNGVYVIKFG